MNEGFVKAFSSMLDSSVWGLDAETRIVWFTLMLMADKNGMVHAAIPGIARRAAIGVAKTEAAMEIFQAPDPDSRNEENEGRRVERRGRSWKLLNYEFFRNLQAKEAEKARKREWWRKNRGKGAKQTELDAELDALEKPSTKTRRNADADADADAEKGSQKRDRAKSSLDSEFDFFWEHCAKKVGKLEAKRKFKIARKDKTWPGVEKVVEVLVALQSTHNWSKDGRQYQPGPAKWLHGGGWNDEVPINGQATLEVIEEFERQEAEEGTVIDVESTSI
jgi:hypothetical protein